MDIRDLAEAYVAQPSNWEADTPERVRLAEIDAFEAGYAAAREGR